MAKKKASKRAGDPQTKNPSSGSDDALLAAAARENQRRRLWPSSSSSSADEFRPLGLPGRLYLLTTILLLLPLAALWCAHLSLDYFANVLAQDLFFHHARNQNQRTVALPTCYGPTTSNLDDLIVRNEHTLDEAEAVVKTHGAAVIPSVLSRETASALREHVLAANVDESTVHDFVMVPERRHHIALDVRSDPSVGRALGEIATHPILRPLVDRILGPNSSLVSLSPITVSYGARSQNWHADARLDYSKPTRPETLLGVYTLALPLQDTTREMGATGICPGTHSCVLDRTRDDDPCSDIQVPLNAGGCLLYDNALTHRGVGHTDPAGPDRVVLFVTLAEARVGPSDRRLLPPLNLYTIRDDHWGHTIRDLETIESKPWTWMDSLRVRDLLFGPSESEARPWSCMEAFTLVWVNTGEGKLLGRTYTRDDALNVVIRVMEWAWTCAKAYGAFIALPLLQWLVTRQSRRSKHRTKKKRR